MEVRSELGIMSEREPFNIGGMQNPPVSSSQPPPMMPGMRLGYAPDGTAVYKPMTTASHSPYQGGGGGGGGGEATAAVTPAGVEEHPHLQALPQSYGLNINMGEPMKRKRGRPRKYGPEGTMALGLVPMSSTAGGATPGSDKFSPTSPTGASPSSASAMMAVMKKSRGRPAVSGRKQQMDALGSAGTGFTPHIITVLAGEDVFSKIMSFSQHGPRAVCILSANGVISNVTLRQPATSGGTVTLEGRFEILSLSGSYLLSENGGQRSRTGGLSVCLAGPDGRILGGGVAGQLTAASPVQVVVGSFIADGRKESKPLSPSDPASAPGKVAPCSMLGPASPPPLKGTMSESSGGPGSPLNQSTGNDSSKQGMPNMPWK